MSPWPVVGMGFGALALVLIIWPALAAGRSDDKKHGRLEEQQADR